MSGVTYWFDGGGGTDGPSGWGWVCDDGRSDCGGLAPGTTSNVAEYTALTQAVYDAINAYRQYGETEFHFIGDSKLVVEQVNGRWAVHSNHLRPFVNHVKMLLGGLPAWTLTWVSRKQNRKADDQAWRGKERWIPGQEPPRGHADWIQEQRGWKDDL